MTAPLNRTAAEEAFVSGFADAEAALPSADWLKRKQALAAFTELGLPHRRIEAWKYTDLRNLVDGAYPARTDITLVDVEQVQSLAARSIFASIARSTAVFVDGMFRSELSSLPEDGAIEVLSLADGLADAPAWVSNTIGAVVPQSDDAVSALNLAYMSDGAAIHVSGKCAQPLELVFVHSSADPHTVSVRNLIVLDDEAECEIFETHVAPSAARYVSTAVTEVVLGNKAVFNHVKTQNDGLNAIHLSNMHAKLGAEALFSSFSATSGARVSRQQAFVEYAGEHTEANISGVYLLAGKQHGDSTLVIDHAVPNCISREMFKLVLDDQSRGVFQGKVTVRPHAQKTDGKQMAQALLLGPDAEFDSKPELEIFADDVVCGHGATAGELDEDLLFYLRARGIPKDQAMALLIAAFVGEAVEEVGNEAVRDALNEMATNWLTTHKTGA